MASTYAEIQAQIAALTTKAEAARAREIAEVITKMKDAIKVYGLRPADLFGPTLATAARRMKGKGKHKAPRPAKFHDGNGNAWHGMGRRPEWFKKALKSGKTAEDLLI